MTKPLRILFIVSILLIQVGCDQISKKLVREQISDSEHISVVKNFVTLTKVENSGAFLSLGQGLPGFLRVSLLIVFPVLLLLGALWFLIYKSQLSVLAQFGIAFMIGGGIGNLIDRILYGTVTDFLHMDFQLFQTGVFNMADVSIMAGVFMIIVDRIYPSERTQISD